MFTNPLITALNAAQPPANTGIIALLLVVAANKTFAVASNSSKAVLRAVWPQYACSVGGCANGDLRVISSKTKPLLLILKSLRHVILKGLARSLW